MAEESRSYPLAEAVLRRSPVTAVLDNHRGCRCVTPGPDISGVPGWHSQLPVRLDILA